MRRVGATIAGGRIQATLRKQVVRRYQEVPYSYHRRKPTGELLSHAGNDVDAAAEVLAPLPYSTGVLVILVLVGRLAAGHRPVAGAGRLHRLPGARRAEPRVPAPWSKARPRRRRSGSGVGVGRRPRELRRRARREGARRRGASRATRFGERGRVSCATPRSASRRIRADVRGRARRPPDARHPRCCCPVGAWRVDAGAITAGTVVAFVSLFQLLVFPLRLIGYVLGELPRAVVGYDRIQRVLAEPIDPRHAVAVPPS